MAFVTACNYYGANIWASFILLVSLIGFQEFKSLCNQMGTYPLNSWIYFFITAFILLPLLTQGQFSQAFVYTYSTVLILASYVVIFPRILLKQEYKKFEDITASLWAVFHLGLLPSFFTWIRLMDNGFLYTMLIVIVISANDTGSLFVGRAFGKVQLAPTVSPNKTVAGSIGGLVFGSLAFWLCCKWFGIGLNYDFFSKLGITHSNLFLIVTLSLGVLFSIVAQIGDLLVSAMKRAAGVKDTGTVLLSHGGVLDRIDSHFFAVWFAYFCFAYLLN